jgi:hypothetical protein
MAGKLALRPEDFDSGFHRPGGDGATGDQAAAAHRHDQRIELRHILQHLHRAGALARDHQGIVIGMDEGEVLLLGDAPCLGIGFHQARAMLDHGRAEIAGMLDLVEGCGHRHHDGGGDA